MALLLLRHVIDEVQKLRLFHFKTVGGAVCACLKHIFPSIGLWEVKALRNTKLNVTRAKFDRLGTVEKKHISLLPTN